MNSHKTYPSPILESSFGRQTQAVSNSLAQGDKTLDFKPRSSHPGPIVINRKKTFQSLMKQNLKEIRSITFIDYAEIPDLSNQDLKVFFDWICRLDNLHELSINLSHETSFYHIMNSLEIFKSSLKKIHPITNITSLKINLSNRNDVPSDIFQHLFRKLPHLSQLDINLRCGQLKEDLILELAKSMNCLSCSRELSLNLSDTRLESTAIVALMSSLKSLRSLRVLELNFYGCHGLDTPGIESLCKALGSLVYLQGLSLKIRRSIPMNSNNVRSLICSIKKLKNISRLLLSFTNVGLLDLETIQILMGYGGSFDQLTHLNLDLPFRSQYLGVSQDFVRSFPPLANLSVLKLVISDFHTGTEWIKEDFWEGLPNFPKLSKLCLRFDSDSRFMDQMLRSLGRILHRLRLKGLDLNFHEDLKMKPSTWGILFDGIDTLDSLNRLSLDFPYRCGISSSVIQKLGLNLTHIKSLVDLTLCICTSSGATQASLQSLGLLLKNQKNLNTLRFNFLWDNQLKPQDLRRVFSALTETRSLTKISLFVTSKLLPRHGNEVGLLSYMREISSLRHLELEACRCGEPVLLAFGTQLSQLSQLVSITLRFYSGKGISPQTKLIFSRKIRQLKDLKQFHLSIQENKLCIGVHNFDRISWGMKDIYAGYDSNEINNYQRRLKIRNRENRISFWIAFFLGAIFISILVAEGLFLVLSQTSS